MMTNAPETTVETKPLGLEMTSDPTVQTASNSTPLVNLTNSLPMRLEFIRNLKSDIIQNRRVLKSAKGTPYYEELKKLNDEMIARLEAFDVYQQKSMYVCWRCKEDDCICDIHD